MTNLTIELGKHFRAAREALGEKPPAMAKRLGISPRQLERIEAGSSMPRNDLIMTLQRITRKALVIALAASAELAEAA